MADSKGSTSSWFFRVFGTCLILSPTCGIASAVSGSSELGGLALVLLAGAGLSLVAGIIAVIWGQ